MDEVTTTELNPELTPEQPVKRGRGRPPGSVNKAKKTEDVAPQVEKTKGRKAKVPAAEVPMPRAGVIAAGMNKLYIRAGKLITVFDSDIGYAMIEVARKRDTEDVTVGEAWEELAKTNPRLRRFLLTIIKGNSYYQLFWAHAPILLAIMMKESVRKRIPFGKMMAGFLDDDADGPVSDDNPNPFAGLTAEDLQQAMGFAQQIMPNIMNQRKPEVMEFEDVG